MISSSFLGLHFAVLPFTVRFHAVWISPGVPGNAGQTFVSLDDSQSCQHCLLKACPFPAAWEPRHCWLLRIGPRFFSGLPVQVSPYADAGPLLSLLLSVSSTTHAPDTVQYSFPVVKRAMILLGSLLFYVILSAYQKPF